MTTRMKWMRITCTATGLFIFLFVFVAKEVLAQNSDPKPPSTANSELTGQLTKALSITPEQASGGAGALFGLAKSRLSQPDFSKVAASVPGIDGLMKAAPASSASKGVSGIPGLGGLGGLASVAGSFQKLGLPPDMAGKFVPVLTKYVESKGGASVASSLAGALK